MAEKYTLDIPAGPIRDDEDAKKKCPIVCAAHMGEWNGQWKTVVEGKMSVCGCTFTIDSGGASEFTIDVLAGPILNNDDAKEKCPIVCASYGGEWNGQWRTVVEGKMSVCGCILKIGSKPVITGPVVAHFFGMFDWYDDPRMIGKGGIIDRCDFSKMNILIVAWCDATNGKATYIRDAAKTKAIYKQIIDTARAKNPDIVILLASNFGNNGVVKPAGASASSASAFASQLKNLITDNGFDGFCLDYESDNANETQMTNFCEAIKTAMPDKILAISPAPVNGLTVNNITYYDYVLPQTYDHAGFTDWQFDGDLENKIGKNRVLLGRNIEGKIEPNDKDEIGGKVWGKDPLKDGYGGVFDWRVDQDTRTGPGDTPTFKWLPQFWNWMHPER